MTARLRAVVAADRRLNEIYRRRSIMHGKIPTRTLQRHRSCVFHPPLVSVICILIGCILRKSLAVRSVDEVCISQYPSSSVSSSSSRHGSSLSVTSATMRNRMYHNYRHFAVIYFRPSLISLSLLLAVCVRMCPRPFNNALCDDFRDQCLVLTSDAKSPLIYKSSSHQ